MVHLSSSNWLWHQLLVNCTSWHASWHTSKSGSLEILSTPLTRSDNGFLPLQPYIVDNFRPLCLLWGEPNTWVRSYTAPVVPVVNQNSKLGYPLSAHFKMPDRQFNPPTPTTHFSTTCVSIEPRLYNTFIQSIMKQCSEEDVDSALKAIKRGRSLRKAALEWGVPRTTRRRPR